jgi:hypothetical protein
MRSVRQYLLAAIVLVLGVAAAAFVPVLRQTPGLIVLSVLALVALLIPTGPALIGIAVGAVVMVWARPAQSIAAESVRVALYFILGGAFAAIRYGRQRAVDASAQYRMLFDENPLPMWLYGEGTLEFIAVNQAALDRYGYTREEFRHLTLRDIERAGDVPAPDQRPAKGFPLHEGTWRHQTKDGTQLQVLVRSHLVDHEGRPARLALLEDITHRAKLESELRQSQKMEALGRVAGGVAHDFNNLLTAMMGFSELALARLTPDDPVRADIEEVINAGNSAASLTRQLLAFSRKQILAPQILDLNALVRTMQTLLRRVIGEDLEFVTTLGDPLNRINADRGQLEQVIMNLAVNARDAMPTGGLLCIATANVELDEAWVAAHPGAAKGPHVRLTLSDTGTGIDPSVQAHLFEPFFTTKHRGKGTGLGLATVYGIVKQSGGYIWVESTPGQGTTFSIVFPASSDQAAELVRPERRTGTVVGTETILVAEDQREMRGVVRESLTRNGYTVLEAEDGHAALALLRKRQGSIHLLLTDVVMPLMSGRELAAEVSKRYPTLRIMYMSGYTGEVIVDRGVLELDIPFLQKPFTADRLLRDVREVLDAEQRPRQP